MTRVVVLRSEGSGAAWRLVVADASGAEMTFTWRDLLRNGTHPESFVVGGEAWVLWDGSRCVGISAGAARVGNRGGWR